MLEYLRIRHLALIEDVELEFGPGLNALTGETGAGKSFILRALNFLLGEKLSADMVRPGQDKAQVEALFSQSSGDLVIKRELSAGTGRSRLFVGDSLSSQEVLKPLRPGLLMHVSQHGQQRLLQPSYQARLVDAFLPTPSLVRDKERLLRELKALAKDRNECHERCHNLAAQREFLEYQLQEIEKVDPKADEEQELENRRQELRHMEEARQSLDASLELLRGQDSDLIGALERLEGHLEALARLEPGYADSRQRVEEMAIELRDLESTLRREDVVLDAEDELERIEARLWALAQLRRKLNRSLEEILNLRQEISDNLSFLDQSRLELKQLDKRAKAKAEELGAVLERLNAERGQASAAFSQALSQDLKGLGFNEALRVEVEFTLQELHPGLEEFTPRILWAPNPGQPAQPLDRIASGGELSRFLLAVVGLMAQNELPTLIFDEVDAGVGGMTLNRLAERLAALAERQQVVLITHWPQLASRAGRHFLIQKEVVAGATYTRCQRLEGDAVVRELTRMAGGGDQGRAMAEGLLKPFTS